MINADLTALMFAPESCTTTLLETTASGKSLGISSMILLSSFEITALVWLPMKGAQPKTIFF